MNIPGSSGMWGLSIPPAMLKPRPEFPCRPDMISISSGETNNTNIRNMRSTQKVPVVLSSNVMNNCDARVIALYKNDSCYSFNLSLHVLSPSVWVLYDQKSAFMAWAIEASHSHLVVSASRKMFALFHLDPVAVHTAASDSHGRRDRHPTRQLQKDRTLLLSIINE